MRYLIILLCVLVLSGCGKSKNINDYQIIEEMTEEEAYPYYFELKKKGFDIEPKQGNQLLGYAIIGGELTPIFYCRASKKWGDRIAKKEGQYYIYIFKLPPLLDIKKVEDFYKSLEKEKPNED